MANQVWKYRNIGTADLLTVPGTTVTVSKSKSIYGTAFYQTAKKKCFDIPTDSKEIWIKFDVYFNGVRRWRAYDITTGGNTGITAQTSGGLSVFSNNVYTGLGTNGNIPNEAPKNTLQTYLLHMVSDVANGVIEYWRNGIKGLVYTGNVNNGMAFATVYLQSEGAGTLFSNVIISNAEIALDENADETYIYTFDTVRNINVSEISNFDTKRQVSSDQAITYSFDTRRKIAKELTYSFDTSRDTGKCTYNFDTDREVTCPPFRYENYGTPDLLEFDDEEAAKIGNDFIPKRGVVHDDYSRYHSSFWQDSWFWAYGKGISKSIPDSARRELWIRFDVLPGDGNFKAEVYGYDSFYMADEGGMWRGNYENGRCVTLHGYAGTNLHVSATGHPGYDNTCAGVFEANRIYKFLLHVKSSTSKDVEDGEIEIWLDGEEIFSQNGKTMLGNTITGISFITEENGALYSNVIISNTELDPLENITTPVEFIINNDTRREALYFVNAHFDTRRNLPRKIILPEDVSSGVIQGLEGEAVQSFEVAINAQQLTDQIRIVEASQENRIDVNMGISGQFYDYDYNLLVESVSRSGILNNCSCMYNMDELLYTPAAYEVEGEKVYDENSAYSYGWLYHEGAPSLYLEGQDIDPDGQTEKPFRMLAMASGHVRKIAENMHLNLVMRFDDFRSTMEIKQKNVPYADLISNLFGWTSRIPHKLINAYIRGNTLYVIQRGREGRTRDISDTKHTRPIVRREIVRMTWGAEEDTEIESKYVDIPTYVHEPVPLKHPGGKKAEYSYDDGLVSQSVTHNEDGSVTTVDYSYMDLGSGRKFLCSEHSVTMMNNNLLSEKTIEHTPLGNGQEHIAAYDSDGADIGGAIGKSMGDDKPSQWAERRENVYISNIWKALVRRGGTLEGNPLIDPSFPVCGDEKLEELTAAVKWLNRSIRETVTLDVYDYPHILTLDDTVQLDGKQYYVQSNVALRNARIVNKQSLTLVRWEK